MFSNVSDAGLLDSSPGDQLQALQRFSVRVAQLEAAYCPLVRKASLQSVPSLARAVAQYRSSMCQACEAFLNGSSPAEQLVYSSPKRLSSLSLQEPG